MPDHTIITYTDGNTTEVKAGDDRILTQTLVRNVGEYTTIQSVEIGSGVTSIGGYAFYGCSSLNDITFNKTMEEVSSMTYYPWAIPSGKVIKCTDGDITVS